MKKILYLAKILNKCGNGLEGSDYAKKKRTSNIILGIFGLLVAAGLFILGMNLTNLEPVIGNPYIIMTSLFMAGTVANIVLEIPGLIENLYMGQDNYILLGLPFSPFQIVVARVISSLAFPTCIAAAVVFPVGIGYIISNGVTLGLILTLIFAFISIICISMSFDIAVVIIILSIVKVIRNRDSLRILGALLLLVLLTAWIIYANSGINKDNLIEISAAMSKVTWILPVNFALIKMLEGEIWLSLLETILITAGFVIIAYLVAKFLYLDSVLKMQDTASANGNVDDKEYAKLSKNSSIVKLVAMRDFHLTSRNPAYVTNGYLFPIVIPIVIAIAFIISSSGFTEMMPLDSNLGSLFMTSYLLPFVTIMGTGLGALSYTCISREGSSFDMLRILPVPFEKIIKGKELLAFICNAAPMMLIAIIGCLVGIIGFGMKVWILPYAIVYSFFLSVFAIDLNMIRDMKHPNLVWDNEGIMIKNGAGLATFLIMIVGLLLTLFPILICLTGILVPLLIPFNIILSGVLALVEHQKLKKWSKKVATHLNM